MGRRGGHSAPVASKEAIRRLGIWGRFIRSYSQLKSEMPATCPTEIVERSNKKVCGGVGTYEEPRSLATRGLKRGSWDGGHQEEDAPC